MKSQKNLKHTNLSLVEWFKKHNISGSKMSVEYAIQRAIIHEQLKHELTLID